MLITESKFRRLIRRVITEISSDDMHLARDFFISSGEDQSGITYQKILDTLKQWYRGYDKEYMYNDPYEAANDLFSEITSTSNISIAKSRGIDGACANVVDDMTAMGKHNTLSEKELEKNAVDICVAIVRSFMPMNFNYNADRSLGTERGFGKNMSVRDTIKFGDDLKNIADLYMQHNVTHNERGAELREKDRLEKIRLEKERDIDARNDEYISSLKSQYRQY